MLDKVTDLLLFFGKLLVVGGVGEDEFYLLIYFKSCISAGKLWSMFTPLPLRRSVVFLLLWTDSSPRKHVPRGNPQLLLDADHRKIQHQLEPFCAAIFEQFKYRNIQLLRDFS